MKRESSRAYCTAFEYFHMIFCLVSYVPDITDIYFTLYFTQEYT